MKATPLLLLVTLASCAGAVWCQTPERSLRQLNHRLFTAAEGAPSDVYALAQTPDGTLWIGGANGLTRFDGMRFVSYPESSEEPLPSTNIASLLATPDGGLWIGFRPGGVSLLKGGHVTSYGESDGLPDGTVAQFAQDRDGSIWAAARLGLVHLRGKRWEMVADEPRYGSPYGVIVDRAGTLWVATVNGVLARAAGESGLREVDKRAFFSPRGPALAAAPDGGIWAAAAQKLVRFDRPTDPPRVAAALEISGGPLLFDEEGNLWAWDTDSESLLRVPFQDMKRDGPEIVYPETLSRVDGVNSGRAFALLEDREQNVWVGTNSGLHRFSRSNVMRAVAAPPCLQYLTSTGAFAAGDAGTLWLACGDASEAYVDQIRGATFLSHQITPEFNVAYRDSQGTLWFVGPTALAHIENGRVVSTPLPAHVGGRPAQALVRDASGAIWLSASRRGVFRFLDGEWSAYGSLDDLPRGYALTAAADEAGALWFGYSNNRIARVTGRQVQRFDTRQGLAVGTVLTILAQGGQLWVGGELGFARFDGERFVSIHNAAGIPFKGVSGIVSARNGDLWLNGTSGVAHISRQEIERVLRDPTHRVACEILNYLDGIPGTATQLRPQPSAIETTDGRVWFSMTTGIISIDATRLARNTLPPPVTIWSLTSGPKRYPNFGATLSLPVHTTDLQIEYSAGSLTVPERVRFRYKLEGSDRDWHDVGARREALYTNLGPGKYRFRVIASNNDGVWNNTGASLDFAIAPAFYQTKWFYALCGLAFVALLTALYRVRVRQVAAQVRGRLEARLAERERIARDLHDTLLQGMQGLIWRFQAATDRLAPGEPARELLEQSLDRADRLLGESRDRVKDLRPSASDVSDLAQALAAEGEQFAQFHAARFRVNVLGARRDLHPIVREEGFLIGREALTNAFRHAGAGDIEAEVAYGDSALHVRVRDDGQGISAALLGAGGRPGHFGLVGMRERAKKLGAHLEVWSKPGAGTEIELRVPAAVAYRVRKRSRTELDVPYGATP